MFLISTLVWNTTVCNHTLDHVLQVDVRTRGTNRPKISIDSFDSFIRGSKIQEVFLKYTGTGIAH